MELIRCRHSAIIIVYYLVVAFHQHQAVVVDAFHQKNLSRRKSSHSPLLAKKVLTSRKDRIGRVDDDVINDLPTLFRRGGGDARKGTRREIEARRRAFIQAEQKRLANKYRKREGVSYTSETEIPNYKKQKAPLSTTKTDDTNAKVEVDDAQKIMEAAKLTANVVGGAAKATWWATSGAAELAWNTAKLAYETSQKMKTDSKSVEESQSKTVSVPSPPKTVKVIRSTTTPTIADASKPVTSTEELLNIMAETEEALKNVEMAPSTSTEAMIKEDIELDLVENDIELEENPSPLASTTQKDTPSIATKEETSTILINEGEDDTLMAPSSSSSEDSDNAVVNIEEEITIISTPSDLEDNGSAMTPIEIAEEEEKEAIAALPKINDMPIPTYAPNSGKEEIIAPVTAAEISSTITEEAPPPTVAETTDMVYVLPDEEAPMTLPVLKEEQATAAVATSIKEGGSVMKLIKALYFPWIDMIGTEKFRTNRLIPLLKALYFPWIGMAFGQFR